jgi:hypothetical protein
VATRAPYHGGYQDLYGPDPLAYRTFHASRANWTYLQSGIGREAGRFFLQARHQMPVAAHGESPSPISVGFRF